MSEAPVPLWLCLRGRLHERGPSSLTSSPSPRRTRARSRRSPSSTATTLCRANVRTDRLALHLGVGAAQRAGANGSVRAGRGALRHRPAMHCPRQGRRSDGTGVGAIDGTTVGCAVGAVVGGTRGASVGATVGATARIPTRGAQGQTKPLKRTRHPGRIHYSGMGVAHAATLTRGHKDPCRRICCRRRRALVSVSTGRRYRRAMGPLHYDVGGQTA